MSETLWKWEGARWWKVDFHSHTPASEDYGKGPKQAELQQRTPREWLLDYMRAGIDCVAVTDHNSGGWIDELQSALAELEKEEPEGYRPLVLFPGVEISVNGGVHLLAILDPERTTSDVDTLLGAVGFRGAKGKSDAVTGKAMEDVAKAVEEAGGIPIPAHVDDYCGVFEKTNGDGSFKITGPTLERILACRSIFAMEVVDPEKPKPALYQDRLYQDRKLDWTEVLGSDAHHPSGEKGRRYSGSHFTWVKMGEPTLEGLRLALLDGELSVRRSDSEPGDPNEHAPSVLESIEISKARYLGQPEPMRFGLNPWLNTIIGGRGTGKSTLVEFLRIALRREEEIPDELEPDFEKYRKVYEYRDDEGLLTPKTRFVVTYRKDGSRFRIQWSESGELDPIEEEREDGSWARAEGEIPHRFPVRIYSQKQIFQLAKAPLALLKIIDDAPEVGRHGWNEKWREEESRFLSLRAKAREIEAGLSDEPRLRGELADVKRKLAIFEEAGHAEVLNGFQRRSRQQRAVERWEEEWADAGARIRSLAAEIVPEPLDGSSLDSAAEEDAELLIHAKAARGRIEALRQKLDALAQEADEALVQWREERDASSWKQRVDAALGAYENLGEKLAEEGAGDPAAYGELVQRRQIIEQRLEDLAGRREQVDDIRRQAEGSLEQLAELRRELTRRRERFLESVLEGNPHVRIEVLPYGGKETVEAELRERLHRESGAFEKDIGTTGGRGRGLIGRIYQKDGEPQAIEDNLAAVKSEIRKIATGESTDVRDQRFATHLGKLPPETLDRLDLWFPEDSLDVKYSASNGSQKFRSIREGSPGQKTAALLAFLLSYGEEPLVLDQPEDDLDNHLIYDLIVTQLREVKRRRQLLVVTHNPNIVVNGDAELVIALRPRAGQSQIECRGSLQEREVRKTICEVMEGGREAFDRRYRRIAL